MRPPLPPDPGTDAWSAEQANGLALVVPPALVELLAARVVELLADRLPGAELPSYLTVEQAASYLACRPHRIYDLVSQRRLRHFRDGRRVLFRPEDLDAALTIEEAK